MGRKVKRAKEEEGERIKETEREVTDGLWRQRIRREGSKNRMSRTCLIVRRKGPLEDCVPVWFLRSPRPGLNEWCRQCMMFTLVLFV